MSDGRYDWLELHLGSCPILMIMIFEHLKLTYKFCFLGTLQFFSLTHFSPVFRFIQKLVKQMFCSAKKMTVPIWNATIGRNGLKRLSKFVNESWRRMHIVLFYCFILKLIRKNVLLQEYFAKIICIWAFIIFTWEFSRFFFFLFW